MMNRLTIVATASAWLLALSVFAAEPTRDELANWAQWRGPLGTGVSPDGQPPLEWNEEKNIRWKSALPGKGHSTPIVWGDRIFLTSTRPIGKGMPPKYSGRPGAHNNLPVTHDHEFLVLAVNRRNGKVIWQQQVQKKLPHEGGHETGSLASASPTTDGKHVFAFFGSHGLFCLDFDGKVVWKKEFGEMHTKHGHGEGSSPTLHGDTLVVNWDHEGKSFITALNKATGKERWKVARDEVTSWTTPIVVEHNGTAQVIVPGTVRMRGYNLATGKVIWECGGLSHNIVASPVSAGGLVFAGSSYEKQAMLAIRLDGASGDITDTDHVLWSRGRGTPYVPSPLLYGDALYYLTHYQAIFSRVNAKTGEGDPGAFRIPHVRNVYASPVGAADRIYITDLDGTTLVMNHGKIPRELAVNRLNDSFSASAAIVGRELFLRGEKQLYCIAEE